MEVKIANICGLCAGASRAVDSVRKMIVGGKKVALLKELLHNKNTVDSLLLCGARQIENIDEAKSDECVVVRAHGEPKSTFDFFDKNHMDYVDLTCPNVKNIQKLIEQYSRQGYRTILIGKYGANDGKMHPEVFGSSGWSKTPVIFVEEELDLKKLNQVDGDKFFACCQTTFCSEKAAILFEKIKQILQEQNKEIVIKNTICNAQISIKESSKKLAENSDFMIVVGGKNSSNTKELVDFLSETCKTYFIEDIYAIKKFLKEQKIDYKNCKIGLSGGASTEMSELIKLKEILEKM